MGVSVAIKTRLIKIGNSRGVRIPKVLVEELGLGEGAEIEMEAQGGQLVIRPIQHPRMGWDERFRAMAEQGDDQLLDAASPTLTTWDEDEWEWS
jgi:antitoxin MazE